MQHVAVRSVLTLGCATGMTPTRHPHTKHHVALRATKGCSGHCWAAESDRGGESPVAFQRKKPSAIGIKTNYCACPLTGKPCPVPHFIDEF